MPWDLPAAYSPAELIYRDGKWKTLKGNSEWSATGLYLFVRLDDRFYVCRANLEGGIGHIELSQGRSVNYAGEVKFGGRKHRGLLRFWNNVSGHYRPPASTAHEAHLPIELFRSQDG